MTREDFLDEALVLLERCERRLARSPVEPSPALAHAVADFLRRAAAGVGPSWQIRATSALDDSGLRYVMLLLDLHEEQTKIVTNLPDERIVPELLRSIAVDFETAAAMKAN